MSVEGVIVHDPEECEGEACCFHNPSDHHMKSWPLNVRFDWGPPYLTERICPHGIGHPDPDSVAYMKRVQPNGMMGVHFNCHVSEVHGCDGCCRKRKLEVVA